MTSPKIRRPLPALIFVLALCLLAALVWWRVLNRDDPSPNHQATCSTTPAKPPTQLPKPTSVTLSVLNSTSHNGLGASVVALLKKDGFRIPSIAGNDAPLVAGVAEIRYGPTGAGGALLLAYYVPDAKLVTTDSTTSTVVLSIGAKYKSLTAPAAVTAKLKAGGITLAVSPAPVPTPSSNC
ncbi:MAG: LytR C-terminal domain-containing protein [Jatrophihabitantaceae bacterium]